MTRVLGAALLAFAVVLGLGALYCHRVEATAHSAGCVEDEPCWDWRTMGNHTARLTCTLTIAPDGGVWADDCDYASAEDDN